MSKEIKIGDLVSVNKIKNGYYVGGFKGKVLDIDEKRGRAKVKHYKGNYWYSLKNIY